jgi:type I restriction enzyme M protein
VLTRYLFEWEHLPTRLIRVIAQEAGITASHPADDLAALYGTPPDEEFVKENWDVLREEWLPRADEARPALVRKLWDLGVGYADDFPAGGEAEMAFLRTCNNARRLREAVLAAFIRFGGRAVPDHLAKKPQKANNAPVTTAAPPPKIDIYDIADRLWETADELRANSHLKSAEYSIPVLGLIFLKFADSRFGQAEAELAGSGTGRREIGKANYQAKGVLYLPEQSRFAQLLRLKEGDNLGKAINDAMAAIEGENPALTGVLPRTYQSLTNATLISLLRSVNAILGDIDGDAFGKVYEYFLGKFAIAEGAKGGEYFTPTSIVRLIVEIIEPFTGKILDPACGSGGMFVQSARFIEEHRNGNAGRLSIYGQERVEETVRLCKMNLAVHGLEGQVSQSNAYYEDPFRAIGQFDYVMANPPFNVNKIDKAKLEGNPRFPFGLPRADNGNYIWIQEFYSTLNDTGRAGFVMANSAADASGTELEIRKKLIAEKAVDVMVAVGTNFFYTVTLPVTLWFLDRGKRGMEREDKVLFIDARKIFRQVDRAHRDWRPEQIEYLANIARLYRGENTEITAGSAGQISSSFPDGTYVDVPGLCAVATLDQIEKQGWSLNPGRYVGVAVAVDDGIDFRVRLEELNEELEKLNTEAAVLQERIATNIAELLS